MSTDALMARLDEEARNHRSSEPEIASMLEDIVEEVAVLQLPPAPDSSANPELIERERRLIRRAHYILSKARCKQSIERLRKQLTDIHREAKEMGENDYDATIPDSDSDNYKRKRTGNSPPDPLVLTVKEKLKEALKKIKARRFQSRSDKEKKMLLRDASRYLR